MANPIVEALEQAAERIGRSLSRDAGKAIEDMYRSAGKGTEDVVKRITDADAEHASKLVDLAERLGSGGAVTTDAGRAAQSSLRSRFATVLAPEGSWEGEGGLHLSRDENAAADRFLARAKTAESRISPVVTGIKDDVPGAEMAGYPEYVLKSPESFKRKFATSLDSVSDRGVDRMLGRMKDSVRYTLKLPGEGTAYTDGVNTAVDRLKATGFENVQFKNFWESKGYQGINSFWRDTETGHVFEMQFHTNESFDAKMTSHGLYEEARLPGTDPERIRELEHLQGQIFDAVPRPGAISQIRRP